MTHEIEQSITKDQESNQLRFSISHYSIWASSKAASSLYLKYSCVLLLWVFSCPNAITGSSFLVTRCPSLPVSTHFSHFTMCNTNRKVDGEQRPYFLYVQPACYTMEQEVPGNCKGGPGVRREDKVLSLSYKLVFPSLLLLFMSVVFHHAIIWG